VHHGYKVSSYLCWLYGHVLFNFNKYAAQNIWHNLRKLRFLDRYYFTVFLQHYTISISFVSTLTSSTLYFIVNPLYIHCITFVRKLENTSSLPKTGYKEIKLGSSL